MADLYQAITEALEAAFGVGEDALLAYATTLRDRGLLTPEFAARINERVRFLRGEATA